jgi:hypothetical protein
MADVTFREIDEMDPILDGLARRARTELGVTAWGMQVLTLPPNWDGYPLHVPREDRPRSSGRAVRPTCSPPT